jgi:hypothetical protein
MFDEAAKTVYGLITTDFVTSYQLWIEKLGGEAAALMVVKETMPVMSDPTSISNALSELGTRLPALPSSSPSSGSPSGRVRASPPVLSRTKSRSAVSVEREKSDVEAPPTASPSWMKKKGESTGGSSRETSPRPVQTLRGDYSQGHTAMEGQSDASSQEGEHHLVEPGYAYLIIFNNIPRHLLTSQIFEEKEQCLPFFHEGIFFFCQARHLRA